MKKIILLLFALVLIVSCTEQPYYEIPLNADGTVYLTGVPVATTPGISTLDGGFTVTAQFVTAKAGDVMNVELLQLQAVTGQSNLQLLPMEGTQSTVTVASDLTAEVTYTRATAMMAAAGDYVTCIFSGATDYAKVKVSMIAATTVSKPMVGTTEIDVARTLETAYFNVTIAPIEEAYTGTLVAQVKQGVNGTLSPVAGSPFLMASPILVPISGADFAALQDTNYYVFTATKGSYSEAITYQVIVRDPYFYLKKAASLDMDATLDLLINEQVTAVTANQVAISASDASGAIALAAGTDWLAASGDNSLEFVPSNLDMYNLNSTIDAIAYFDTNVGMMGTSIADPRTPVYIFKATNGTTADKTYYGMIKFLSNTPTSVSIEYRIGNQYAHLLVIK